MIDVDRSLFVCICGGVYNNLLQGAYECGSCEDIMKITQTKVVKKYRRNLIDR